MTISHPAVAPLEPCKCGSPADRVLNADNTVHCSSCVDEMKRRIDSVRAKMDRWTHRQYVESCLGGLDHGRIIRDIRRTK